MDDAIKKNVDESWKEQAEKEKSQAREQKETYHEPTFSIFVSSLSMQAMIGMGKLENPVTGKPEKNLEQARFLIDTLSVIQGKTKGNLTPDEQKLLDEALYSLRMMYVQEKEVK